MPKDFVGRKIKVGDWLAGAVQWGSSAAKLRLSRVYRLGTHRVFLQHFHKWADTWETYGVGYTDHSERTVIVPAPQEAIDELQAAIDREDRVLKKSLGVTVESQLANAQEPED